MKKLILTLILSTVFSTAYNQVKIDYNYNYSENYYTLNVYNISERNLYNISIVCENEILQHYNRYDFKIFYKDNYIKINKYFNWNVCDGDKYFIYMNNNPIYYYELKLPYNEYDNQNNSTYKKTYITCPNCNGSGMVKHKACNGSGYLDYINKSCSCENGYTKCIYCGGCGKR